MIQIYDQFQAESRDLAYSLTQSGYQGPILVVNEDGFLPEGVTSPYAYFCQMESGPGKPLYFNEVPVPAFWEITASNSHGEIWNYDQLSASIYYAEPKHLRLVKNVDWLDGKGKVRFTDHYNQYGWLYARTFFQADQQVTIKKYFNRAGQEVIVENCLTGSIVLSWEGKVHVLKNRVALLKHYFEVVGLDTSRIWYNSLSTPFFLSYSLSSPGEDILFWQEPIGDKLPGNMEFLLGSDRQRTQTVVVQQREVYQKILSLLPENQHHKVRFLGYSYPERRANHNRKQVLILTNSDQVEQLDYVTSALPDYQFHVAALTEMSSRLHRFDDRPNVHLYPNVSRKSLDRLYETCDVYLDINHGGEVMDAVRQAFEHNMLILAFSSTLHQPSLVLAQHVFSPDDPSQLVFLLGAKDCSLADLAHIQRRETSHESVERYREVLGEIG